MTLALVALLLAGRWSAPIPIWAKNPITHRWYKTQAHYWIDAAQPQLEEPERRWRCE